jgi:hypothetical protein
MYRIIRIPKLLQDLHGKEASIFSIVLVYFTGIIFGVFFFFLSKDFHSVFHRWLLAVIACDMGGGVVANMSQSTSDYYAKRPKTRWIFIFLHIIHPLLLWIVFPETNGILIIGGTTIIFTSIVNIITKETTQRIIAGSLIVINLMLLILCKIEIMPLILLTVFSLKLIVGFAVRWNFEN